MRLAQCVALHCLAHLAFHLLFAWHFFLSSGLSWLRQSVWFDIFLRNSNPLLPIISLNSSFNCLFCFCFGPGHGHISLLIIRAKAHVWHSLAHLARMECLSRTKQNIFYINFIFHHNQQPEHHFHLYTDFKCYLMQILFYLF